MNNSSEKVALGIDFGTESVRALFVDLTGKQLGSAVVLYRYGQIVDALPTAPELPLPPDYALQHPQDWIESAIVAVSQAKAKAKVSATSIVGIGVDFTSCTLLPTLSDGTPLCLLPKFEQRPLAWPKLWKHHGAKSQADLINKVAQTRGESFLARYGGVIGVEWFFPKVLETIEHDPLVSNAAEVWIEAGDWFVWQLVGGDAASLARSTCQAGYKAMWSEEEGYPSAEFLRSVHPALVGVVAEKLPGKMVAPGKPAGGLGATMAARFGLQAGTPVSAAIIDAHAGVPGAGAADPDTLVLVMGTSGCYMLNSKQHVPIPGVAGIVKDGILEGYFGYETGQAAVGDAFDWGRRLFGHDSHDDLALAAQSVAPGANGVRAVDWFNGCRTPLMDSRLTGGFIGLTLAHSAGHLYRALLEASGFGVRWIVETMRNSGLPVKQFVATGGLPHHNPLIVQIYSDILGEPISIHPCQHGPALGSGILGALAGSKHSGFKSAGQAIRAMAQPQDSLSERRAQTFLPNEHTKCAYDSAYREYRTLGEFLQNVSTSR